MTRRSTTAGRPSFVVAIDNHEQVMKITEFARKTNPGIKIVARSYDAQQTYELYHAGADEIVRENFDSAVRCGKRARSAAVGWPEPATRIHYAILFSFLCLVYLTIDFICCD